MTILVSQKKCTKTRFLDLFSSTKFSPCALHWELFFVQGGGVHPPSPLTQNNKHPDAPPPPCSFASHPPTDSGRGVGRPESGSLPTGPDHGRGPDLAAAGDCCDQAGPVPGRGKPRVDGQRLLWEVWGEGAFGWV